MFLMKLPMTESADPYDRQRLSIIGMMALWSAWLKTHIAGIWSYDFFSPDSVSKQSSSCRFDGGSAGFIVENKVGAVLSVIFSRMFSFTFSVFWIYKKSASFIVSTICLKFFDILFRPFLITFVNLILIFMLKSKDMLSVLLIVPSTDFFASHCHVKIDYTNIFRGII